MLVYLLSYPASYLFAKISLDIPAGLVLLFAALNLYFEDYAKEKRLIHLRGIFALSFVGGQGISCFKLSHLQRPWNDITWMSFFLAFSAAWLSYEYLSRIMGGPGAGIRGRGPKQSYNSVFFAIPIISMLSLTAFVIEVSILKYIPFFVRGVPHAYSYFHVSGLHYFTVSCVLVPALSVIYYIRKRYLENLDRLVLAISNFIALSIPILCVSRFQFLFAVLLAVFCFFVMQKSSHLWIVFPAFLCVLLVYIILTIARSHDIAYLNEIFEMRFDLPIFISQPYIYIANNYDNFNHMTEVLPRHSYGLKMLFPLFALSGLKFRYPRLVDFPIYTTKTELSTVTLFYDAYYDFGVTGVILFSLLLGAAMYAFERWVREEENPISILFYAQFGIYLLLSFFTTWFSNPTIWFYFLLTLLVYLAYKAGRRREQRGRP